MAEGKDHDRPEIDRQEVEARARRETDAAEIGPGCAIDAERQGVSQRAPNPLSRTLGEAIAPGRDDEKQAHIKQARKHHCPAIEHDGDMIYPRHAKV